MSTLPKVESRLHSSDGDHDKFAHYVDKDEITFALVHGAPVIALCGKVWVPSRDPDKYAVCKTCADVFSKLSS